MLSLRLRALLLNHWQGRAAGCFPARGRTGTSTRVLQAACRVARAAPGSASRLPCHRFDCPVAPSRAELVAVDAEKLDNGAAQSPETREGFVLAEEGTHGLGRKAVEGKGHRWS